MNLILDMVHHNPGEAPFSTRFLDPDHVASRGFNGMVFKHLNCVATFAATGLDLFPPGSPERDWLEAFTPALEAEIRQAKARGLMVFHHLDLFVLPTRLVEHWRDEICDPVSGLVRLDRPRTLELHRILFDELCQRFPKVDGFIVRVGGTYLFDTPFHTGNSPIPACGRPWDPLYGYDRQDAEDSQSGPWGPTQEDAYIALLRFLREEICVRHGKRLLFRTWDIFPDRLHAVPAHYLAVTDAVDPHPLLAFSIKHTALDFWRRVKVNECLGRGRHPQVIEVQCQREYEGKGAFPNYIMHGVIDGFEENRSPSGLRDLLADERITGIFCWSRGGGWHGPSIRDELWCDLNAWVLGRFATDPRRTEESLVREYAESVLGLAGDDVERFRRLVLLAARAVLMGRYCAAFDETLDEALAPTGLWMRDDRLGGMDQLAPVLDHLGNSGLLDKALREKDEAVALWREIRTLADAIRWPHSERARAVVAGAEYGLRLFDWIRWGWHVMALGWRLDHGQDVSEALVRAIAACDESAASYARLEANPDAAGLFRGHYFSLPGQPTPPGLDATVDHYRQLCQAGCAVK